MMARETWLRLLSETLALGPDKGVWIACWSHGHLDEELKVPRAL